MASDLSIFRLDPSSGLGIAAQIRARVALLIADGQLSAGDRLPPVRELARHLGVNVNTVRAAYAKLHADGFVRTRHGVGSEVLANHPQRPVVGWLGSNVVGVLLGGLDAFYLPLLRGIEDVAAEQGTLVLIVDTRDSPTLAVAEVRRLIARGVDGIIAVSNGDLPETSGQPEDAAPTPIVYVDQPDKSGHSLVFDGHQAGYLATRHLQEHGHRNIGIVTAPLAWPTVKDVYNGYVNALEDDGVDPATASVAEVGEFSIAAGRLGLSQLLSMPTPPTAVFVSGVANALGVLREAKSRGLAVPGDLAIVGYADSPAAALVEPPLTMISAPARQAGIQAMRTLDNLIRGKRARPNRVVLKVELTLRDSCGIHPIT